MAQDITTLLANRPRYTKQAKTFSYLQKISQQRANNLPAQQKQTRVAWDKLSLEVNQITQQRDANALMRAQEQTANVKQMNALTAQFQEANQQPFHDLTAFFTGGKTTGDLVNEQKVLSDKMTRVAFLNKAETANATTQLNNIAVQQQLLKEGVDLRKLQTGEINTAFKNLSAQEGQQNKAELSFIGKNMNLPMLDQMIATGNFGKLSPGSVYSARNALAAEAATAAAAKRDNKAGITTLSIPMLKTAIQGLTANPKSQDVIHFSDGTSATKTDLLTRLEKQQAAASAAAQTQMQLHNQIGVASTEAYQVSGINTRIDTASLPMDLQSSIMQVQQVSSAFKEHRDILQNEKTAGKQLSYGDVSATLRLGEVLQQQATGLQTQMEKYYEGVYGVDNHSSAAKAAAEFARTGTVPAVGASDLAGIAAITQTVTASESGAPQAYSAISGTFVNSIKNESNKIYNLDSIFSKQGSVQDLLSTVAHNIPMRELVRKAMDATTTLTDPTTGKQSEVNTLNYEAVKAQSTDVWDVGMPPFLRSVQQQFGDVVASRVEQAIMQHGSLKEDLAKGMYNGVATNTADAVLNTLIALDSTLHSENILSTSINLAQEARDFLLGEGKYRQVQGDANFPASPNIPQLVTHRFISGGDALYASILTMGYKSLDKAAMSVWSVTRHHLLSVPLSVNEKQVKDNADTYSKLAAAKTTVEKSLVGQSVGLIKNQITGALGALLQMPKPPTQK